MTTSATVRTATAQTAARRKTAWLPLPAVAAVALLGSAAIHATVVSDHHEVWPAAGLFFVVVQVVQTLAGLAVLCAPSKAATFAGLAVSVVALVVWTVSRTVGMPLGPDAMRVPEEVGAADLSSVVLELAAVALLLASARERSGAGQRRPTSTPGRRSVVAAVAVLAALLVTTTVGLSPAITGTGHVHSHAVGH